MLSVGLAFTLAYIFLHRRAELSQPELARYAQMYSQLNINKNEQTSTNKVTAPNKAHHFHFPLVRASEPILGGFDGVSGNLIPLRSILYEYGESTSHSSQFISIFKKEASGPYCRLWYGIRPILESAVKIGKRQKTA